MRSALIMFCFLFAESMLSTPQTVAKKMGAEGLRVSIASSDFDSQAQQFGTKTELDALLEIVLTTILTDDSDSESPLSILEESGELNLLDMLNQESSELKLLCVSAKEPEHGESIADSWIFSLVIPSLSDHLFWVIVDRNNEHKPYIYGFN